MGRIYEVIDERLAGWMERQPLFFVATSPLDPAGHVNCSPKGNRQELAVLDRHRLTYVDQTGSGVETIAHLQENGRIVLMWCAFEGSPRIVRVHGRGRVVRPGDPEFSEIAERLPRARGVGVRSAVVVQAHRISDSCGFGIPLMAFSGHRSVLDEWAERKGPAGIAEYWTEKNAESLDGLPGV